MADKRDAIVVTIRLSSAALERLRQEATENGHSVDAEAGERLERSLGYDFIVMGSGSSDLVVP